MCQVQITTCATDGPASPNLEMFHCDSIFASETSRVGSFKRTISYSLLIALYVCCESLMAFIIASTTSIVGSRLSLDFSSPFESIVTGAVAHCRRLRPSHFYFLHPSSGL